MSHFMITVFSKEYPIKSVLSELLQPYHQYECTGIKDKYVVLVDNTDQHTHDYNNEMIEYIFKDNVPLCSKYDNMADHFWTPGADSILILPPVYETKNINVSSIYTFNEYLLKYCGINFDGDFNDYIDGRVISYTNPNYKWDWYEIGGRWSNALNVIGGTKANSCRIKDLDFDFKRNELAKTANDSYDYFLQCLGNEPHTWTPASECVDYGMYYDQPVIQALNKADTRHALWLMDNSLWLMDNFLMSRDEYVKLAIDRAYVSYAVLVDEVWYETDDSIESSSATFNNLIEKYKDYYITVVDCHI